MPGSSEGMEMVVPIYTNMDDVLKVIGYLKTKATGIELAEARKVIPQKHLDGRKLSAMQTWGILSRS